MDKFLPKLRSENEITKNWKTLDPPLVSVVCITYNHEPYIRDAIEGFLIQETDFPFEIIIHDDASTDRTAEIVKEFESRYPTLIKGIYQTENQYSKGKKVSAIAWSKARGEFIAFCEGDDYWIDPKKLEKQKCFLDNHPDYGAVFSDTDRYYEETGRTIKSYDKTFKRKIPTGHVLDMLLNGRNPYVTCSSFFRSHFLREYESTTRRLKARMGDYVLWLIIAGHSQIGYIRDTTSVYRIRKNSASRFDTLEEHMRFRKSSYKVSLFFSKRYQKPLNKKVWKKLFAKSKVSFCIDKKQYRKLPKYLNHPLILAAEIGKALVRHIFSHKGVNNREP